MVNVLGLLEAQKKYGEIHNGVWGNESQHCTLVQIPSDIGSTWINSLTKEPVSHIYCNKDLEGPLLKALGYVKESGLIKELKTFDGCLMIRDIRAQPGTVSCHSYGMAIDINAFENQLGRPTSFSPEFIGCWKGAGFFWGGNFKRRIDPMHWTLGW